MVLFSDMSFYFSNKMFWLGMPVGIKYLEMYFKIMMNKLHKGLHFFTQQNMFHGIKELYCLLVNTCTA